MAEAEFRPLMEMAVVAVPRSIARCESLLRLPKPSRGTPKPAESLRNTNESADAASERTIGLALTNIRVELPATGGFSGRIGMIPDPVKGPVAGPVAMILFSPFHAPPGCHPQPAPVQ